MMILKEFSRIVCVSLFSYQGLFCSFEQLVYFISFKTVCQELFLIFFEVFNFSKNQSGEGGI